MAAEPTALKMHRKCQRISTTNQKLEQQMYKFAQDLEFEKAAAIRNQLHQLREQFVLITRNASLSWRSVYLFSPEEYKLIFI